MRRCVALPACLFVNNRGSSLSSRSFCFLAVSFLCAFLAQCLVSTRISAGESPVGPYGVWLAEDILGGGVADQLRASMEIRLSGETKGFGGCNRFRAKATVLGETISFTHIVAARMTCAPIISGQEAKFLRTLARVQRWDRDLAQRKLSLRDEEGHELMLLSQVD